MKKLILISFLTLFAVVSYSQDHVEIPNAFTPNGDGINDVFQIRTVGYTTLNCKIYNRQGGLVYQFFGLNGSWDGYPYAGEADKPCTTGVYFVILELGNESGEIKTFQGDLHLFR